MNKFDGRIKINIFKSGTTYQDDYVRFPTEQRTTTLNCDEQLYDLKKIKQREHIPIDNETFVNIRPNVHVPFNLLWRPREIINTNPYVPFQAPAISDERDAEKEHIRKTRPRIYISPAVSVDDIDDPDVRKIVCNHMYTSEWTKAIQESEVQAAKKDVPNSTVEPVGDPVRLKMELMPPLPPSFRNKGKDWENRQLKMTVDPTKTFWQHKDSPVKCGACFDPIKGLIPEETTREIHELIDQDRLRLAHDSPIPGYTGYKPRFAGSVPLAKADLPVSHPFLSVTQAITKRYAQDKSPK